MNFFFTFFFIKSYIFQNKWFMHFYTFCTFFINISISSSMWINFKNMTEKDISYKQYEPTVRSIWLKSNFKEESYIRSKRILLLQYIFLVWIYMQTFWSCTSRTKMFSKFKMRSYRIRIVISLIKLYKQFNNFFMLISIF